MRHTCSLLKDLFDRTVTGSSPDHCPADRNIAATSQQLTFHNDAMEGLMTPLFRPAILAALSLSFLFALPGAALAQDAPGSITGRVIDGTSKAVAGASVLDRKS